MDILHALSSTSRMAHRLVCLVRGHELVMQYDRNLLSLRCLSCGYRTQGWALNERPPRQSATVVPLNDTASGPPGISFDAGSNTFIYNWQTDAGWTGCRKLTLRLRDNSQRELRFRFQ